MFIHSTDEGWWTAQLAWLQNLREADEAEITLLLTPTARRAFVHLSAP